MPGHHEDTLYFHQQANDSLSVNTFLQHSYERLRCLCLSTYTDFLSCLGCPDSAPGGGRMSWRGLLLMRAGALVAFELVYCVIVFTSFVLTKGIVDIYCMFYGLLFSILVNDLVQNYHGNTSGALEFDPIVNAAHVL